MIVLDPEIVGLQALITKLWLTPKLWASERCPRDCGSPSVVPEIVDLNRLSRRWHLSMQLAQLCFRSNACSDKGQTLQVTFKVLQ